MAFVKNTEDVCRVREANENVLTEFWWKDLDGRFGWSKNLQKVRKKCLSLFVDVVSRVLHVSVEAPLVGVIVDGSDIAIRLHERVLPAHDFSVTFFLLVLDVSSWGIVDTIFEGVLGIWVSVDAAILLFWWNLAKSLEIYKFFNLHRGHAGLRSQSWERLGKIWRE